MKASRLQMYRFVLIFLLAFTFLKCGQSHIVRNNPVQNSPNANSEREPDSVTFVKTANKLGSNKYTPEEEKNPEFWRSMACEEVLRNVQNQQLNLNRAKNIILFLGDGMSITTITSARILKGQRNNQTGEEASLSFEKFPHTALSRVSLTLLISVKTMNSKITIL